MNAKTRDELIEEKKRNMRVSKARILDAIKTYQRPRAFRCEFCKIFGDEEGVLPCATCPLAIRNNTLCVPCGQYYNMLQEGWKKVALDWIDKNVPAADMTYDESLALVKHLIKECM